MGAFLILKAMTSLHKRWGPRGVHINAGRWKRCDEEDRHMGVYDEYL
jgi:hypothetical protein